MVSVLMRGGGSTAPILKVFPGQLENVLSKAFQVSESLPFAYIPTFEIVKAGHFIHIVTTEGPITEG